jgi:hypothetical protein
LHWRGRSRGALLTRLRSLRAEGFVDDEPQASASNADAVAPTASRSFVGAAMALAEAPDGVTGAGATVPADRYAFWDAASLPAFPPYPELPVNLLLRQLPTPSAAIGGAGLLADLEPLYALLASPPAVASPKDSRARAPVKRPRPGKQTD